MAKLQMGAELQPAYKSETALDLTLGLQIATWSFWLKLLKI